MSRPPETETGLGPQDAGPGEGSHVRGAIAKFLLIGLLAMVLVATPVTFWIRSAAERHALDNAILLTQRFADLAVAPLATKELLAGDAGALASVDRALELWQEDTSALRIKVWDSGGRIVYSDVRSLVGRKFELPGWAQDLLAGGPATASLESQAELENEFEAGSGELVEVYVSTKATEGTPLIFEAYYDDGPVREEQQTVLISMVPPLMLSLAALQLAQLLPAVRLARGVQSQQMSRNRLLRRAVEASDLERRRIARDLHDEVIQDLSGLAYALESEELHGPAAQRPVLAGARVILQNSVRALRAMTSELYPPDLQRLGLRTALERLADPLREKGIAASLLLPGNLVMDRDRSTLFYRVAREALANTVKHSGATAVALRMELDQDGADLSIADNGSGFEATSGSLDGHFGLRILQDTISEAGGSLEIRSLPGTGTTVTVRLPAHIPALR